MVKTVPPEADDRFIWGTNSLKFSSHFDGSMLEVGLGAREVLEAPEISYSSQELSLDLYVIPPSSPISFQAG